jgi:hypothetical protein
MFLRLILTNNFYSRIERWMYYKMIMCMMWMKKDTNVGYLCQPVDQDRIARVKFLYLRRADRGKELQRELIRMFLSVPFTYQGSRHCPCQRSDTGSPPSPRPPFYARLLPILYLHILTLPLWIPFSCFYMLFSVLRPAFDMPENIIVE